MYDNSYSLETYDCSKSFPTRPFMSNFMLVVSGGSEQYLFGQFLISLLSIISSPLNKQLILLIFSILFLDFFSNQINECRMANNKRFYKFSFCLFLVLFDFRCGREQRARRSCCQLHSNKVQTELPEPLVKSINTSRWHCISQPLYLSNE